MRGQPSTRTDLFFPILLTLLTIKRLSHTGLFSLSFSSVQCSIKYNVVVVVVYDLLVCRSVLKMFARFIFRMEQEKASQNG